MHDLEVLICRFRRLVGVYKRWRKFRLCSGMAFLEFKEKLEMYKIGRVALLYCVRRTVLARCGEVTLPSDTDVQRIEYTVLLVMIITNFIEYNIDY
jgi:hypothetical protein